MSSMDHPLAARRRRVAEVAAMQSGSFWRRPGITRAALVGVAIASASLQAANATERNSCFANLAVAIDIGHTRASPGSKDVFGRAELEYNSELVDKIQSQLARSGIG